MKKTLLTLAVALFGYSSYAQWSTSGSNVYYNSGNVGIGTSSPSASLHVVGTTQTNAISFVEDTNSIGFIGRGISITGGFSSVPDALALTCFERDFAIGGWSKTSHTWNGVSLYINSDNNNVGIGTTSPAAKLDVDGDIYTRTRILSDTFGGYSGGNVTLSTNTGGTAALVFSTALTENMRITSEGNVAIGTVNPNGYKLAVNGNAIATSMTVKLYADWPDYVFKPSYHLPTLTTVKAYIDKNKHLPDMPSEQQVKDNGINLGEIVKVQTKKIEELTLYLIDKDKQLNNQQKEIEQLKQGQEELKAALLKLTTNSSK